METELSKLADELFKLRARIKTAEAKVKPLKDQAGELEAELQHKMLQAKLQQVATKKVTIAITKSDIAELLDDQAFFAYVAKKKAWDLVRKQVNVGAARLRWEDDLEIPGVRHASRIGLSITARRAGK